MLISYRTRGLTAKEKFWDYFQNSEKRKIASRLKLARMLTCTCPTPPAYRSLGPAQLHGPTFLASLSGMGLPAMAPGRGVVARLTVSSR
jgi:hypothetical protein